MLDFRRIPAMPAPIAIAILDLRRPPCVLPRRPMLLIRRTESNPIEMLDRRRRVCRCGPWGAGGMASLPGANYVVFGA